MNFTGESVKSWPKLLMIMVSFGVHQPAIMVCNTSIHYYCGLVYSPLLIVSTNNIQAQRCVQLVHPRIFRSQPVLVLERTFRPK